MASIKISELRPAGSELFQDSESFLNELNDRELDIQGGGHFYVISVLSQYTYGYGISIYTQSVVTVKTNKLPKLFKDKGNDKP